MWLFRSIYKERIAVLMVAMWKSGEAGRRGNRLHVTLSTRFYKDERSQWSSLSFGLYGTISVSTFEPTRSINRRRAAASAEHTDRYFFILFAFIRVCSRQIHSTDNFIEWPIEARKITTQSFKRISSILKQTPWKFENNCYTTLSLSLSDSINNKKEFIKYITKRKFKSLLYY